MEAIQVINQDGPTKYNNAEHSEFHAAVHTYLVEATASVFNCTNAHLDEYAKAQKAEEELIGRQTASLLTADIEAADAERDALLGYMYSQIESISKSPVPAQREAGRQLTAIIKPFRGVFKNALAQENTEVRSLISHLQTPEAKVQIDQVIGLADTIAALAVANDKVADLMSQRTGAEQEKAESRAHRAITDNCYTFLVQRINATLILYPTPEVQLLVTEINNLIARTKNVYNQRMGVKHANDDK